MGAKETEIAQIEAGPTRPASKRVPEPEVSIYDREIPSAMDLDMTLLDPNYEYRFVFKSPTRIARCKAKGYVKVNPDEEEVTNTVGDRLEVDVDGFYTVGDVILMKCRRQKVEQRREADRDLTNARLKTAKAKFKKEARRAGTTTRLGKEE